MDEAPSLDDAVHRRHAESSRRRRDARQVTSEQPYGVGRRRGDRPRGRRARPWPARGRCWSRRRGGRTAPPGATVLRPDRAVLLDDLRGAGARWAPRGHLAVAHRRHAQARAVEAELPAVIAAGQHSVIDSRGIQWHQPVRAPRGDERWVAVGAVAQEDVRRPATSTTIGRSRDVCGGGDPGPSSAIHEDILYRGQALPIRRARTLDIDDRAVGRARRHRAGRRRRRRSPARSLRPTGPWSSPPSRTPPRCSGDRCARGTPTSWPPACVPSVLAVDGEPEWTGRSRRAALRGGIASTAGSPAP